MAGAGVPRASDATDPAPVTVLNESGSSPVVLLCEHASNHIPVRYQGLGLQPPDLSRHIAWDIGVAQVARNLSVALDAPLALSGYSRLLIDCNRPLGVPSSIPEISELTEIPGNRDLSQAERDERATLYYWPFQHAVAALLDARQRQQRPTMVLGVHSFTPVFKGFVRPWHGGVLFRRAQALGNALVAALREPGLVVEANQPYQITDGGDYTVPVHGEARGLDAVLVEIRQDLILDAAGIESWSARLTRALGELVGSSRFPRAT